jgi:hypothetical protein
MSDDCQYAPATLRNRDFILDVLRDVLPTTGVILEVASGSGEHIVHFAKNIPALVFQPSDPGRDALLSIAGWMKATGVTNVRAPIALAGVTSVWPIASANGYNRSDTEQLSIRPEPSRSEPELGLRDLEAVAAMACGRTRRPEDSTSADGRTAIESVMSRGFAG